MSINSIVSKQICCRPHAWRTKGFLVNSAIRFWSSLVWFRINILRWNKSMDCFPLLEKCLVWISLGNVQICLECGGIFKNDFTTSWYSNESNSLYDTPVACCCVQQAWREGSLPKGCLVYVPLKCAFTLGIRVLIYYVLLHPDESTSQTCSLVELCWSRFVGPTTVTNINNTTLFRR